MMKGLTPSAEAFLNRRGIDPDTALRYGVHSSQRSDLGGEVIVFPFIERGAIVNNKYRGRDKQFRQDANAIKTWWNHDAILDPALRDGSQALIITEGEIDALTAIECGFPLTISVPDGAPKAAKNDAIDPEQDTKFSFVWRSWDALKTVKRIIIATDADEPGQALAAELVRRFGAARCSFVTYPEGCKDLNEVRVKHGPAEVVRVLAGAKLYPVSGLYRLSEYPEPPPLRPVSTGWTGMDRYLRLYPSQFVVVTGVPNHGKSTWLNNLAMNVAKGEGWHCAIATFEARVKPFLRSQLRRLHGGMNDEADAFIEDRFAFIDQTPAGDDDDADIDWLLDKASDSVIRNGTKLLIVDPWNEIEHKRGRDRSETEYIGHAIRQMKRFGRDFDCVVAVVAHPQKMNDRNVVGGIRKPTLYDINGSANWYNKADHGIVVHRPDVNSNIAHVSVQKVREQPMAGTLGTQCFQMAATSRVYVEMPDSYLTEAA